MDMTKVLSDVSVRAERANPRRPGDYEKNGILICGKCNTPKQVKIRLFGREVVVACMCRCAEDAYEAEKAERKAQELRQRIAIYRQAGFPESDMQKLTFDTDDGRDPRTKKAMERYVEKFRDFKSEGKGLVLFGPCGTGKTFAAACVVNALIDQGRPCLMTNFSRVANTLSGTFDKQEYLDSLNAYDLIVLDDLGAERSTSYMVEVVYNIIDARYRAGLPMIITTNLSGNDLLHPRDIAEQRVFNRILERCFPLEVRGPDRRQDTIRRDYGPMKRALGLGEK